MQNKENKFISYLKNYKIYIISFLIGFILLFFLMNQVVMYADDFLLKLQSKASFATLLKNQIQHYFNWGGGLTQLLVTGLFKVGNNAWKFVISIIITLMFYLISKIFSKNKKQFLVNFSILWALFYSINICIVRECVYWLDGSMAYTVVSFNLFMYIYIIYTRFILEKNKKYDVILIPLVSLFSGWSSAQTSGATLIITIIFIIWYKLIKHKKINKKFLLLTIFSLIGSAIFLLSPGNNVRMEVLGDFSSLSFINKILYRIGDVTNITFNFKEYSFTSMPLFVYLFSYLILFLNFNLLKKSKNKKEKFILIILLSIQLLFLATTIIIKYMDTDTLLNYTFKFNNLYNLKINNELSYINIIPYVVIIVFLLSDFITIIIHSKKEKNILLLLIFVVVYVSQYSMMMVPFTPYRTCLTAIIFLIFGIAYLLNYFNSTQIDFVDIMFIMLMYINIYISIIAYVFINILIKNNVSKKLIFAVSLLPIFYVAAINYKTIYIKYRANKTIYEYNVEKLENYNKGVDTIYLKRLDDENYAFSSIIGEDWIERDVKLYFNIPEEVKLKYEGE